MSFFDDSMRKCADKLKIAHLDGQRLFDTYNFSSEKRVQIRSSPVMVKRIVSYSLNIHPRQMDDTFASAALENIYRAHERYRICTATA